MQDGHQQAPHVHYHAERDARAVVALHAGRDDGDDEADDPKDDAEGRRGGGQVLVLRTVDPILAQVRVTPLEFCPVVCEEDGGGGDDDERVKELLCDGGSLVYTAGPWIIPRQSVSQSVSQSLTRFADPIFIVICVRRVTDVYLDSLRIPKSRNDH